jgi:hypothetical protein
LNLVAACSLVEEAYVTDGIQAIICLHVLMILDKRCVDLMVRTSPALLAWIRSLVAQTLAGKGDLLNCARGKRSKSEARIVSSLDLIPIDWRH